MRAGAHRRVPVEIRARSTVRYPRDTVEPPT